MRLDGRKEEGVTTREVGEYRELKLISLPFYMVLEEHFGCD